MLEVELWQNQQQLSLGTLIEKAQKEMASLHYCKFGIIDTLQDPYDWVK